ncbi:MAG: Fic family protein [Chlamydiae bacterium]|nr:Fic family protein [Chlamydiota bacterium]
MIFQTSKPDQKEIEVVQFIHELRDKLAYIVRPAPRWYGLLRRNVLARAIRGSNSIEGYHVSKDEAIAAVEGEEPQDEKTEAWKAVIGYRQAMTYVLQLEDDPYFRYSTDLIRSLHFMMLDYDLSKSPGKWRPGYIQVVDEEKRDVVYVGPDADVVPSLMTELVDSLNQTSKDVPSLIMAAMAHLNLAMIHPFRDGNGRMARCLQTLVLVRDKTVASEFSSIEEYLGRNTRDYYDVLSEVGEGKWNPKKDTRPWIRFCLKAHYSQAQTALRRVKEMSKLWDILESEIKKRNLLERMITALADAAYGYHVRNPIYKKSALISEQVASRDLKKLADQGLLIPQGEARGRYYVASDFIKGLRESIREPRVSEDPFREE